MELLPKQRLRAKRRQRMLRTAKKRLIAGSAAIILLVVFLWFTWLGKRSPPHLEPIFEQDFPPLVMHGGDPYIRAMMRTISASETNDSQPYSILYGGQHVQDLSHHPDLCVKIVTGPNRGKCSTAAGRYQLLDTTWSELAERYHPLPSQFLFWESYNFEPEYQDAVVYAWLNDPKAWGADVPLLLRQGKLEQVRQRLSGTWTSLGYGIESNSMTRQLPKIYQKMLQEELQASG